MDLGEIYGLDRIIGHFFLTSHEIQHSAEYRYEYYFPHTGTLLSGCAGCAYLLSYQESRFVSFRSFNRLERTLIWKL